MAQSTPRIYSALRIFFFLLTLFLYFNVVISYLNLVTFCRMYDVFLLLQRGYKTWTYRLRLMLCTVYTVYIPARQPSGHAHSFVSPTLCFPLQLLLLSVALVRLALKLHFCSGRRSV
jgi:hypothetical protein